MRGMLKEHCRRVPLEDCLYTSGLFGPLFETGPASEISWGKATHGSSLRTFAPHCYWLAMPGHPWTTKEQDAFLHTFDNDFLREQDARMLETWFPTVYDKFLDKWPEEDPDEEIEVLIKSKLVRRTRLQVKKDVSTDNCTCNYTSSPVHRRYTIGSSTTASPRAKASFSALERSRGLFKATRPTSGSPARPSSRSWIRSTTHIATRCPRARK